MEKFNKAIIMKTAWALAKQGAAKFGGKAVEYLAEALKMVWDLAKKQKAEFYAKQEAAKKAVKIKSWFVNKNFDLKMFYNPESNEVIKETEKAVLVKINDEITVWVPKSALIA